MIYNFDLLCSTINAGIIILDRDLKVYLWNRWLENQTKIKSHNIVGNILSDCVVNLNDKLLKRKIKTALLIKSPTFYTTSSRNYLFKIKLTRLTDAVYSSMQQSVSIMPYDIENSLVIIYIYDQTFLSEVNFRLSNLKDDLSTSNANLEQANQDLQRLYNELKIQKNELQTIFDISKDGLVLLGLDGSFAKFNDAYLEMIEKDPILLQSTTFEMLATHNDQQRVKSVLQSVLVDGFVKNFEFSCEVHSRVVYLNATFALLPTREYIFASIKDITQNKIYDEQNKYIALGQMIGNIAHQWRQPLSIISTIASSIKIRKEYDQFEGYDVISDMQTIMTQTQYLSQTIDDFRNFIKKSPSEKEHFTLGEALKKTLSIAIHSLQNNYIHLKLDLQDDYILDGFENELIQAFINIINNAKDAIVAHNTIDQMRLLFISIYRQHGCVVLEFLDNGGGIDPRVIDRIFEPYFTTKHQSTGTGIGLCICRQIITDHHDARIEAINKQYEFECKEYQGACIRVIFYHELEEES